MPPQVETSEGRRCDACDELEPLTYSPEHAAHFCGHCLEEERKHLRAHDHACCPPDDCCGGPCAAHPCWELTT